MSYIITRAKKAAEESCTSCQGSGWKTAGEEKDRRVIRCDCWLTARSKRLLELARIPARHEHCELSNFEYEGPQRDLASARLAAYRFVEEYPLNKTGLMLIGPIGVGKTHLAVGIIKELMKQKGVPSLFYDYRELLKAIQNSYNPTVTATEMSILRPVLETEVVVLDELGAVKHTDWVWETVSHILNSRYNQSKTTIVTTNFPDAPAASSEFADEADDALSKVRRSARKFTLGDRIGERMRSRLHEMCRTIEMDGTDFRMKVKNASFGQD